MGANLWGESPLWEYRLGLVIRARITTGRRHGQDREGLSEGDGDSPGSDHTGFPRSRRCGELPAACDESAAIIVGVTARRVVTRGVMVQKSAAAIVVFRCFTRAADHEGANMRSRTEQRAARYSTMKPDRASRVRRRLEMPVLYAFFE